MSKLSYKVVGLAFQKGKDHVFFSKGSESLCGMKVEDEDARILEDYMDVENQSGELCAECESRYDEWLCNEGRRAPTVKCKCDMRSEGFESERCNAVISAFKARQLRHPNAQEESVPVCPYCYRWIRSLDSNPVETSYEEAKPWLEKSKTSKVS